MDFYTYLWLREDGTPYYVGKGTKKRAFSTHVVGNHTNKPPSKDHIILQKWPSEELAFEGEKLLIDYYGRIDLGTGCLRNMTDGGEGTSGVLVSDATRSKNRENLYRRLATEEGNKLRFACLGRKHNEET